MQEQNCSFDKFSSILEQELKKRQIQKKDFAKAIGVTPAVISNWMSGNYRPRQSTIDKICAFLNVPRSFFGETGSSSETISEEVQYWKNRAEEAESKLQELKQISQLISQANERLHRII